MSQTTRSRNPRAEQQARQDEALRLRTEAGLRWSDVAATLGYNDAPSAIRAVRRARRRAEAQNTHDDHDAGDAA